MSEELDRVKQDLAVMNAAAGFGAPPVGFEDVAVNCMLGVLGIAIAIGAGLFGLSINSIKLPITLACVIGMIYYHFKYSHGSQRTAARDRAYRWSWRAAILLGVFLGGFMTWAKFIAGLKGISFLGSMFIFSGGLLVLLAITDRWRTSLWGWALLLILFGSLTTIIPQQMFTPLMGVALALGGFASAGILHWQLRAATARS